MTVNLAPAPVRPAKPRSRRIEPFIWLGPALLLLLGVVVYPMIEMVISSFSEIGRSGLVKGAAGFDNYSKLLAQPDLGRIVMQTIMWVVAVVGLTVLISWPVALLLNQQFPGRTLVRYIIIIPWAASVVMTALAWKWMVNYYYGPLNAILIELGILTEPIDWLGTPGTAWVTLIAVGVFVSVPFTTYVLLSGLQTVPEDLYEAAKLDGAGPITTFWNIVRPITAPSMLIAVALNIVGVFNSFPIIWLLTQGGPSRQTHTTITFMYELAFRGQSMGQSAALSVLNLIALLVIVVIYLRLSQRQDEEF